MPLAAGGQPLLRASGGPEIVNRFSMVTKTLILGLLLSCAGYQAEPFAALQYRDEGFSPPGGADTYDGWTYQIGMRYVPPVRLDDVQLLSLVPKVPTTPVPVVVEQPKGEDGLPDEVINSTLENATYAGAASLLALAVVIWVWRRKPRKVDSKP